jgi:hypothetical protein
MKGMIPMRISKKILACVLAALMAISMMPFTALGMDYYADVERFTYEASIYNDDEWQSMDAYFGYGDVYTDTLFLIEEDIVLTKPIVIPAGSDIQFDLQGHSISGNIADSDGKKLIQNYGKLTFVGDQGGCIYNTNTAGQGHAACQTFAGGTTIVNAPITFGDSDEIRNNANNTNRGCGIQNNGGTLIINDGYYTAIDANYTTGAWAYAILNCAGDTVVNNATVYGNGLHGALGCESGTLTVNDGTFAVNGSTNYYSLYALSGVTTVNGGTFTNNGKYGVNYLGTGAETNINGGSFTYTVPFVVSGSKGNPVVSGGTFSGDVNAYCADGYVQASVPGAVATAGVAKVGDTYYEDFEAAVAAARTGDVKTVTVVADVDLTKYPAYGSAGSMHYIDISGVTVDLNEKTMTIGGRWSTLFTGTNGKIMNGTCVGTPSPADYQYGIYIWGPGSGNVANSGGGRASIELEDLTCNYGIHTWNADVTITDCDATGSAAYYGVWADETSVVTIESGNFTTAGAAVIGCAKSTDGDAQIRVNGGNFTVPSGKKLVQTGSSSNPENAKFYGGTVKNADGSVYTVLDANLGFKCEQNMETGVVAPVDSANDGASISVADKISQNVYIDTDYYGEESYATIEYNHASNASEDPDFQTETVQLKNLPALDDTSSAYDGAAMLQVIQAPAQSTEPITVKVYTNAADAAAGTNAVGTIEYSVYNYCKTIIEEYEGPKADELKDLAKATLDYAAAAQTYFNYNTDNMATKEATGDFYNDVASADLSSVAGISSRPLGVSGVTVVVKSDLEINLLSKTPFTVTGKHLDTDKGGTRFDADMLPDMNGDYYVLNIKGIEPANMNKTITVYTTQGTAELTANSVMRLMANYGDAKMQTLAKAMYLYGQAADAYFD